MHIANKEPPKTKAYLVGAKSLLMTQKGGIRPLCKDPPVAVPPSAVSDTKVAPSAVSDTKVVTQTPPAPKHIIDPTTRLAAELKAFPEHVPRTISIDVEGARKGPAPGDDQLTS